jgi:hypothetical protein
MPDFSGKGIVTLVLRLGKCPTSVTKGSPRLCYVWANARLLRQRDRHACATSGQMPDFCNEGIGTLVQRLGKCPTSVTKGSSRLCSVWANARLLQRRDRHAYATSGQMPDLCDEGIVTLMQRLGKCPTSVTKVSSCLCNVKANARLL